jgi:hypothetical protein
VRPRRALAAEGDELDTAAPELEHADGDFGRFLDQRARLLLAAPPEAVGR